MNVISACTRDCYDGCSLITKVRDGVITGIDGNRSHPITQGIICPRLRLFSKNVQSEERLRSPLRRSGERGSGSFERIPWDSALNEISDKIREVIRKYSSSAVTLFDTGGNQGLLASNFPLRFINAINGSITEDTICSAAGNAALEFNFGSSYGYPAERIPDARLIVLWGINSRWTNIHGAMLVQKAKKKGASVVVIDPLKTSTTDMGKHLQIRPGTDAVLALTMINQIIENGMHNQSFIDEHVLGFKNLAEVARKYDIRRGSELTGIDANDIVKLATDFVSLKPSVIHIGFGLQRQRNGGEMVRAISLIPSVVGEHRGFIFSNDYLDFDMDYLTASHLRTLPSTTINPIQLSGALREGKIRVLIIINSNPLATLPNQNAVRSAIAESEAFVVTHDLFMTDTVDFSDIVLPATSMFEYLDIVPSYFHDYLNLNEPAIAPVGESRSNIVLFKSLAKAMGLRQRELFEDENTIISNLLSGSKRLDIDMKSFRRRGFAKMAPLPLDVYQTPSEMIEIYSQKAEEAGLPPVPDHIEIKGTRPFQLLSPLIFEMNHSSYHHLSSEIAPKILINPDDASMIDIKDGGNAMIQNQNGSIVLPVEISDRVPKGVVVSYAVFWPKLSDGKNINFLTSDYVQRFGGNPAFHSTFVDIKAV